MRLTYLGAKSVAFYLALVGAFFASPYSNLFFMLLGFLTLVGIASVLWTSSNVRGVDVTLREPEPVVAGSSVTVPGRIRCSAGRRAFQVSVELESGHGVRLAETVDHLRGEQSLTLHGAALARGVYPLSNASLSSSYPFGVLRARRPVEAAGELVVYPEPASLVHARSGSEALAELLGGQAVAGGDLQPTGLREHREGDELRAVHWRATARLGKPVVREWEGAGGAGLEVLVDRRCTPQELEPALAIVSALVAFARSEKEVLSIATQGMVATFGDGHRPWSEALRFLATADALPGDGPAPPPVARSVTRLPQASHAS